MRFLLISALLGLYTCNAQSITNLDSLIDDAADEAIQETPTASTQEINTNFRNLIRSNSQQQPSIQGAGQGAGARGPTASQRTSTGVPRRASTRRANLFGRRRPIRQQDLPASRAATLTEKTAANVQNRSRAALSALNDNVKEKISNAVKTREPGIFVPITVSCNSNYHYRKMDGTCNNLYRTSMGAAGTPQSRFLYPEYGDIWNLGFYPRTHGKDGKPLPNPRKISNTIFKSSMTSSPKSRKFNVAMTHFGQFIDHDVVATPIEIDFDGTDIECCNGNFPIIRPECFPFSTPPGDFLYTCMNFVRSAPTGTFPFYPGPRQQLNAITSWLDLSQVYGSSDEELKVLSTGHDGLLRKSSSGLPDNPDDDSCADAFNSVCFHAGDHRNSEVPLLTVMHILFLEEHNRIAKELKSRHDWNNDKVLNEARKILTGVYQHIVYNEFLPTLLGFDWSNAVGLMSQPQGHTNLYNSYLDGSTRNAFGAAAYRMGHSLVGNSVGASDSTFNQLRSKELRETFFNTETIRDSAEYGPTRIGRWMSSQYDSKMDRFLSKEVRDHLFQDENNPLDALDLGALNIQRGRDHGLPGYNRFRQFCGRFPAVYWTNTPGGFVDHESDMVQKLRAIYGPNVDDVDLYVGALSERPESPDTVVGPTFRCLIAVQFLYSKYADRFFYENNFPQTGFTLAQVNDIKKQTLAGIYCRSLHMANIQPKIFLNPDNTQDPTNRIDCKDLPDLDFDLY